jgi:membrane protein implicated in regulation of membrane protease activity
MDPGDGGPMLFGPFSPLVIAFFLTCFGAVGIMCTSLGGIFLKLALPASMVSGFILAWLLIMAFNKLLGGLHSSSEIRLASLVGCEAEVTVAVPETGVGEIAFVAMGSRNVGAARSDDQTPIARFTAVRISRVVGSTFFVRPVADEVATHMPQDTHAVG